MNNYQPCFATNPQSWNERWEVLRNFTRQWHKVNLAPVGRKSELVKKEEAKLGIQLPPSFQEWIRFSEELHQQKKFIAVLRDDYLIERLEHHPAISLMIQAEGDRFYSIEEENLSQDDPPVESYILDYDSSEEKFDCDLQQAEHITNFTLQHMAYFLYGEGGGFHVTVDSVEDLLSEMRRVFEVHAKWENLQIFENEDMFALVSADVYQPTKHNLFVECWRTMSDEEIPDCILEQTKRRGWFHGKLITEK